MNCNFSVNLFPKGDDEDPGCDIFGNELILQEIFSHLRLKDLKTCRQVNSSWWKEAQRQFATVENIGDLPALKQNVTRVTIRNFPSFNRLLSENVDYAKLLQWARENGPRIKSLRIQNIKWDLNEALSEEEFMLAGQFMKFFTNLADVNLDIGVRIYSPLGQVRPLMIAGVVPSVRNVHLNVYHNPVTCQEVDLATRKLQECMFGRGLIKTFPNVESWTLSSTNEDQKGYGNLIFENFMHALPRIIPRLRRNLKSLSWIGTPSEIHNFNGFPFFGLLNIQDLSVNCTAPCDWHTSSCLLDLLTNLMKKSPNLRSASVQAILKFSEKKNESEIQFLIPGGLNKMTYFKLSIGNEHFEHNGSIQDDILLKIKNNSIQRVGSLYSFG